MKCPCLCCSDFLSAPEDGVMMHAAGRKLHVSVQLEPAPLLLQSLGFSLFFVTEWLLFSCRSSSNNLIRSFFFLLPCLALGCQQVCHDFAHDLLLAECGQWAGLLMDCFLVYFWEKAPGSDEFVSDGPLMLYSCVTQSSLHFCTCLMWGKWNRLWAESHSF